MTIYVELPLPCGSMLLTWKLVWILYIWNSLLLLVEHSVRFLKVVNLMDPLTA